VDNVFDKQAILFDQFTELGLLTNNLKTVSDPRSWGIGFSKRWGRN
jgi:hypothetical protein